MQCSDCCERNMLTWLSVRWLHHPRSAFQVPRKQLTEQLSRVLPADDASIPDHITLVNVGDPQGSLLAMRLQERQQKVVSTLGPADIRAAVTCLVSKIQKL